MSPTQTPWPHRSFATPAAAVTSVNVRSPLLRKSAAGGAAASAAHEIERRTVHQIDIEQAVAVEVEERDAGARDLDDVVLRRRCPTHGGSCRCRRETWRRNTSPLGRRSAKLAAPARLAVGPARSSQPRTRVRRAALPSVPRSFPVTRLPPQGPLERGAGLSVAPLPMRVAEPVVCRVHRGHQYVRPRHGEGGTTSIIRRKSCARSPRLCCRTSSRAACCSRRGSRVRV